MASPARIGRTVRAATITVILAAFAVLPGCLHDSGEPNPLVFTGPSAPVLWGPLPGFSFSPEKPDAGDTVNFDASSSTTDPGFAITSYTWSFASGSPATATGVTASTTFASAGTFAARLTVTDNRGTSTPVTEEVDVEVDILFPPKAVIGATAVTGLIVNFDGTASTTEPGRTITAYAWTFGDNTSGTGATVSHTYVAPFQIADQVSVTLTVTDSAGLTGSTTASVSLK